MLNLRTCLAMALALSLGLAACGGGTDRSKAHVRLVNASSGVSDATVYSAFPIDDAALADLMLTLEKRFKRKLNGRVEIDPELIGGIRVVVGDEVLDTSVKARLEQMKVALTA